MPTDKIKIKSKPLLAVAIMVKDEAERIERTLGSIIKHVKYVVLQDTGSTDGTVHIVQQFCKRHKTPLKLEIHPFIDFSHNRNILLKMCHGLSNFVILLDANDEVRRPDIMIRQLQTSLKDPEDKVFQCRFNWENDNGTVGNNITYYKIAIIRNDMTDIYYDFPVHEYITTSNKGVYVSNNNLQLTDFCIYQDKLKDKPSTQRFQQDIKVLKKYIEDNGENERAYEYLCQTYNLIKDYNSLYLYSNLMIDFIKSNISTEELKSKFYKNYFNGLKYIGRSMYLLEKPNFQKYYFDSYRYCKETLYDNAEILYELATIYMLHIKDYKMALSIIKKCCDIVIPSDRLEDAEVNYEVYNKHRWEVLAKLANLLDRPDDYAKSCAKLGRDPNDLTPLNFKKDKDKDNYIDTSLMTPAQQEVISKLISQTPPNTQPTKEELQDRSKDAFMYLIVSYRDRQTYLDEFIPTMTSYLKYLGIDHKLVVVEQDDDSLFNKGALYNTATYFVSNLDTNLINSKQVYLCFHDVDILPTKGTNYYRPLDGTVNHLYGYKFCLGGVFTINYHDFIKINGFSNKYPGWGYEDNDVQRRVLGSLKLDRTFFYQRFDTHCFRELDSDTESSIKKMELPQTIINKETYMKDVPPKDDGIDSLPKDLFTFATVDDSITSHILIKCNVQLLVL